MRFCSPSQSDTMMMLFGQGAPKGKDQAEIRPHDGRLTRSKWESVGCVHTCNEYCSNDETQPSS